MKTSAVVLGLFSLVVFLASLAAHIAGYIPGSGVSMESARWLHIGAMAAFLGFAIHLSRFDRQLRWVGDKEAIQKWQERHVPRWVWNVGGALFVYAIVNFAVFLFAHEGAPRTYNGKPALYSHGRIVRKVTEEEFRDAERFEVRGVSGHWMMFSSVAALYFLIVYPRARAALAARSASERDSPEAE